MAEDNTRQWKICEEQFDLAGNLNRESLFTLANGHIGIRGASEEPLDRAYSKRGTFINGFYESSTITYGESAYGFAKNMQTMLNVCDARRAELCVDGERFALTEGKIRSYHRELDMQNAVETREVEWESPKGKIVNIRNRHLVSMARPRVAAATYEVTPVNFSGELRFTFVLDGDVRTGEEGEDPRVGGSLGDGGFDCTDLGFVREEAGWAAYVKQSTKRTNWSVTCAAFQKISGEAQCEYEVCGKETHSVYRINGKEGQRTAVESFVSYVTDQRREEDCRSLAVSDVLCAGAEGWKKLLQEQSEIMRSFWDKADVVIDDRGDLTKSMRFNIFQLFQSAGRDSYTSIASKGLSGEGYGGHYFWESEAYIAPMFMLTETDIAKNMLIYRYRILDKAREQARLLGHKKGALYAWRTIGGEESSAYFPAGSAQYHINADIAFAVDKYMDMTEDMEFLAEYGMEILLETARLWIDTGHYCEAKGNQFCIDGVTGPDEYTAIVNNNCYTNVMARENLWNAVKWAEILRDQDKGRYERLCEKIGLEAGELEAFKAAGDRMYIPYDEKRKIHMQDDTFLYKKSLDLSTVPADRRPLLLHYHPLFIYRHQVCKQADLLLAEYFLPDRFDGEDKKRDYEYYEKITTHDSSLSACVFSIMAAATGDMEKAYDYFLQTIRTDLDDNQKNTKDGLHMANMAGAWACLIHGFAGLTVGDGGLSFHPALPGTWDGYHFRVCYRGERLAVSVGREGTRYCVESGNAMEICHKGRKLCLEPGRAQSAQ